MSTESRWFPGQETIPRFESGWMLGGGERWDGTSEGGADLTSLSLHAPRTLVLEFHLRREDPAVRRIAFTGLTELQVDGDLQWEGETELGWEVLDTQMLVSERPRDDGRLVYTLELPQALVCFASLPQGAPA